MGEEAMGQMLRLMFGFAVVLFAVALASQAYAETASSCSFTSIGIVGASNTVESAGSWSGILKSRCAGSQVFISAKSSYSPSSQASELLPVVLANKPDLVIISPSGNGIEQASKHLAAVKAMAKSAKSAGAKVAVLSISPRKYYCYCGSDTCATPVSKENWESSQCSSKWSQSIQDNTEAFNSNLLGSRLGSSDIDYVVDIYSILGSSSDKDVCGYCGNDGGHLTAWGSTLVADAVLKAISGAASASGCGKKIAAVGDSITAGKSYVVELRALCTGSTIQNEDGNPGTPQVLKSKWASGAVGDPFAWEGRHTNEMKADFGQVLSTSPDTVIILGGTNDIFGNWESAKTNLLDMYTSAKAKNIRVVAVTIPPYKNSNTRAKSVQDTISKLNEWILKESPADVKVDIYNALVVSGTDDADSSLFGSDLLHPNSKGKAIMAKLIHQALTTGESAQIAASPAAASVKTVVGIASDVLSTTLYDFIMNSSAGLTTIVGIARQNIAVGINKTVQEVSSSAMCQQISAENSYDEDWLKKTYGQTQLDVESQLVVAKFMDNDIRIHKLVSSAFGCVQSEIKKCTEGAAYTYSQIDSYSWRRTAEGLLSASSFGISVDINMMQNPNSQDGTLVSDIPACVVDAFKKYGFLWGGDYESAKAPAHFEFMGDPQKIVVQQDITCPAGTVRVTVPADSQEAVSAGGSSGYSAPVSSGSKASLVGNSDFSWPLEKTSQYWNNVVSCYGYRTLGGKKNYHDAVDIAALEGTSVVSIADGTVYSMCEVPSNCRTCNPLQFRRFQKGDCTLNGKYSKSKCGTCSASDSVCDTNQGRCGGFGSNIIIKHSDKLYSHYVHLSSVSVKKGESVKNGQQIGAVGNTGFSQGNHLHFALYNSMPRTKTGDPDYPEAGKNPFCYFPDSVLSALDIQKGSCSSAYGSSGTGVVGTTHPLVVKDCTKADLSMLSGLTPSAASAVPASSSGSGNRLVQVCRAVSAGVTAETAGVGMASADSLKCTYCNDGKSILKSVDPSAYASCSSSASCCKAKCPSGMVVNSKTRHINQASSADMGSGSDCWHDGKAPDRPAGATWGESYQNSACGVASARMGLQTFGKDKTSYELFCDGPDRIFVGPGSSEYKLAALMKKEGLSDGSVYKGFDWQSVSSDISSGKVLSILIKDKNLGSTERPYLTAGHFVTAFGVGGDYLLINDPGRNPNSGENVVVSKDYMQKAVVDYVVIG